MLEMIAAQDEGVFLTPAEREAVQAGLDDIARGDIATDGQLPDSADRFFQYLRHATEYTTRP